MTVEVVTSGCDESDGVDIWKSNLLRGESAEDALFREEVDLSILDNELL